MRQDLIDLIRREIDNLGVELAAHDGIDGDVGDTALYGTEGPLSSLELVSLLVAVEQAIEDHFGVLIDLADDRAVSATRSPFRSIGSLAELAVEQLAAR